MPLKLASKETISAAAANKDVGYFRDGNYFEGEYELVPHYDDAEFKVWYDRHTRNELTEAELSERELVRSVITMSKENDGNGREARGTLYFSSHALYVTLTGIYSSWNGVTYDDVFISKPVTHTITVFERIKE
jgi:hypothetical protein